MKSSFKKSQFVWARTKGHPWWPGTITKVIDGNQYAINFIGDDSHSILTSDNLFDFQEKFEEFNDKVKKNKKLKEAIQTAQKLQRPPFSQQEKQKKKHSDSEQEDKKKSIIIKRNLRTSFKKPETPNKDVLKLNQKECIKIPIVGNSSDASEEATSRQGILRFVVTLINYYIYEQLIYFLFSNLYKIFSNFQLYY